MKKTIIALLFLLPVLLSAQTLKGKIVKVQDGDTVILLDSFNTQHKIRLHGIDAPENGQPYGNKSREFLSDLIAGKAVTVDVKGVDQYNRLLGVIYIGDTNINAEMIRAGYAWNYKYSKDKYYIKLQEKAKEDRRGLWFDKNAVDPWQWRKERKGRYRYSIPEIKVYSSKSTPKIYHVSQICPELTKYRTEIIEHNFRNFREVKYLIPCTMCCR